jgi:hypothetical protein
MMALFVVAVGAFYVVLLLRQCETLRAIREVAGLLEAAVKELETNERTK